MIQRALRYADGRISIDDVLDEILSRDKQLWVVFRDGKIIAALVTSIIVFKNKKILSVPFVGGSEFKLWMRPAFELFKQYARGKECSGVEIYPRKGWKRYLTEFRTLYETQVFDL